MRAILLLLFIVLVSCNEQRESNFITGDLTPGVELTDSLKKEEIRSYKVQLVSPAFIKGYVDQFDTNVTVECWDEEENVVNGFNSSQEGLENFGFFLEDPGTYKIIIKGSPKDEGEYVIKLTKVEAIAKDRLGKVAQYMSVFPEDHPGGSVAIMEDGEMVMNHAFGKANLTHDLDFRPENPSNIASVSKQFTATAILLLEEEGKLSLDDDIRKYFPELPDLGKVVTIRNLLHHTSGWRSIYSLMPMAGYSFDDRLSREQVIKTLQNQPELQSDPGERFNYNNSGYIVAALLVEKLSGTDFPSFMKARIFDPLGMEHSYVSKSNRTVIPGAVQGYRYMEGNYMETGSLGACYGAGGIYSTPEDLIKWMKDFKEHTVRSPELIQKLTTPAILNNGDTLDYALGMDVDQFKGVEMWSHSGGDNSFSSHLMYFPKLNAGIVTTSNNGDINAPGMAHKLTEIYFAEHFTEREIQDAFVAKEIIDIPEEKLMNYTGRYKDTEGGPVFEIKLENGELNFYPEGESGIVLEPVAEDSFKFKGMPPEFGLLSFEKNGAEEYDRIALTDPELYLDRIEIADVSGIDLKVYEGAYYSEELGMTYDLYVKDSTLMISHLTFDPVALKPISEDEFSGNRYAFKNVRFLRNDKNEITSFTARNRRVIGVNFIRQEAAN